MINEQQTKICSKKAFNMFIDGRSLANIPLCEVFTIYFIFQFATMKRPCQK